MDRGQEYVIRGIGRIQNIDDIAKTVVAVKDGIPVLLDQVAEVVVGSAPKYGDGSINGQPGVVLVIQKHPGANTLALTERIESALIYIQEALPP